MADWQIHCASCGRFMNPQTPGSSWVFVPSSDAPSYEEDRWQCAPCTEKYGPLIPNQSVRVDLCSGVVKGTSTVTGES